MNKLLDIQNLKTNFYTYEGVVKALDGINLHLKKGQTLGLVGETGCGKSVTALSILRLILPPGKIEKGKILFKGNKKNSLQPGYIDLLTQSEALMRKIRGNEISMIFQEPSSALNPVYSVNEQISESFLLHRNEELCKEALRSIQQDIKRKENSPRKFIYQIERRIYKRMLKSPHSFFLKFLSSIPLIRNYKNRLKEEAKKQTIEILNKLGIPNPQEIINRYPHELSGGMQQRVVIAMALACNPKLLIADEPTSNLDVTIQAQILDLIQKSKEKFHSSILFITHDMGVVAEICKWVGVMYAGSICEISEVKKLFRNPLHPYTKALMNSVPKMEKKRRLESIKGAVPNLVNPPSGCRFHPRCSKVMDICKSKKPEIREIEKGHFVACHHYEK